MHHALLRCILVYISWYLWQHMYCFKVWYICYFWYIFVNSNFDVCVYTQDQECPQQGLELLYLMKARLAVPAIKETCFQAVCCCVTRVVYGNMLWVLQYFVSDLEYDVTVILLSTDLLWLNAWDWEWGPQMWQMCREHWTTMHWPQNANSHTGRTKGIFFISIFCSIKIIQKKI